MGATKSRFKSLLVSLLLGSLLLLSLLKPAESAAGPQFGITPTPTSPPGDTPTPPTGDTPTPTPPTGDTPTPVPTPTKEKKPPEHTIDIQLGCNLVCKADGLSLTVQANVRLIHQGSGWTVDVTISNQGSTHITVPYGGQWEVWLVGPPEVSPSDGYDPATLSYPTDYPVLLGVIDADSGTQLVDCPVNCPAPVTLDEEIPPVLPQTGWSLPSEWIAALAILSLIIALIVGGLISVNRNVHLPFLKGRFRSK